MRLTVSGKRSALETKNPVPLGSETGMIRKAKAPDAPQSQTHNDRRVFGRYQGTR